MSISEKKQAWQATVEKSMAKAPERRSSFKNSSDMELERCYAPQFDYPGYEENLGFPGQFPFTRGVQPTMYRGRFWTMRQYAGFGNAAESNERYKYLLSAGQTGLSIAFDLPTQMGYDSDASMSRGEVGKVGVAIDSLADMEVLFDGIPLDKVSTSMTINSTASILLAMYIAVAEKQGVTPDKISGTIQNDILKEYMARGTYIYPPKESMRIITDIFAYCKDNVPKWNTISISGYHIREAGSSAVQEVAFTLADGIAYVEAAVKAGLDVDEFAPRLAFFFNAHNNLLEEVAKFRAARRMWARIMRERFKAKDPRSQMLRFHTQTAGCTLTAQQPDNNIMRVTLQALAAVLGGTQSLHTNSRDEALALPTEESVRIALRTQQVIAYESGVADSIDPLAGSFLVESLTDQIEQQAMAYIEKIDSLGGAVEAISRGFQQKEIQDSAYSYQRSIEKDETIIVGVNKFTVEEGAPQGLLKVTDEVEVKQKQALAAMKAKRDGAQVEKTLKALEEAAKGSGNLMPYILDAVKSYATLGEIANVMRGVFGVHRETVVL
ncbi:methylmalonyl-CoA mutase family protein [Geomonas sp. Red69]|uniref:Methylmalonyl-CoA mutase family protein n=1 Tax=Geomonas diazotrophica TaxID=2843197 RepID=A0ABX8JI08_9BACT|nr:MULTISPECIES: methylmalonyl-CoA mutase family protein [Geomonas]MBU5635750.1 methylmalonyl-CoA mutase family protein [Geomonas diazotrophica]QWV98014.1 methylmalonyl-CoA mutase family protein [Geomonas nitrogeniifigens]QXE87145.1 methylmalonyl-CoA mutase family protein [Geomonas nitrogeniifigens]